MTIRELFAKNVDRRIEEVVKVNQTDEDRIREELDEYVVTRSIRNHYLNVFERYDETFNNPHEGVGIWVSGFFGSGKSSFAKYLGLAIADRSVKGKGAGGILADLLGDNRGRVLLNQIRERLPTHAIIFDVSTDLGIISGNQRLTEIMYRALLRELGYPSDLDLAELEIQLEADGRLDEFRETFLASYEKPWDEMKQLVAFAMNPASQVMHEMDPRYFPSPESWLNAARGRADITAGILAERCKDLMARRKPGRNLVFVIDEVGQFVAQDPKKMLDLQAVVENLGRVGRGKMWLAVTSQERLTDMVGGLDHHKVELQRLMDRFPTQVHLEQSDISEVTSKRVLKKSAAGEEELRELFRKHRGRLEQNTAVTADVNLPELTADRFVDLYPLLPYQVDLVISIVSGLRTQGGASRHVGGANRTIIKLAQQLIVHPEAGLGHGLVGTLAQLDVIYDLVASNIPSELRDTVRGIADKVVHPDAQRVAKAVCLLQYVKSVHRTRQNLAAVLHPAVEADSCLPDVEGAIDALISAGRLREGADGFRIPTETEDLWERERAKLAARPGDIARLQTEVLTELWSPQPTHSLQGTRTFRAGLGVGGRSVVDGEVPFHVTLVAPGEDLAAKIETARERSHQEPGVFWVAGLNEETEHETEELFRSRETLTRREREARTREQATLVDEEKRRRQRHQDGLKQLIRDALLAGDAFFGGKERSPEERAQSVSNAASGILGRILPDVFPAYGEGAAKVKSADLDSVLRSADLRGLPSVFTDLDLLKEEAGLPVFRTDGGPLHDVLARISNRAAYGENATGRYLANEFGKPPFGWEFDVIRLFVVCLLREGKIEASSRGKTITSATSIDAQATFPPNNHFRQATFRLQEWDESPEVLIDACKNFEKEFGEAIKELNWGVVADAIRRKVGEVEEGVHGGLALLQRRDLPGSERLSEALGSMREIRAAADTRTLQLFNGAHKLVQEANERGRELLEMLTEGALDDLTEARTTLETLWPVMRAEPESDPALTEHAEALGDLLKRETFFRDLAEIGSRARAIRDAHEAAWTAAADARKEAYEEALEGLGQTAGWAELTEEQQEGVARALRDRAADPPPATALHLLREAVIACPALLAKAREHVARLTSTEEVVRIAVVPFFAGGIDSEEQLDQALAGLRESCVKELGQGHRVVLD